MADGLAQRADHMLRLWSDLSMRHVALGGACACGTGGVSLRLEDFELDIVGYLEDGGLRCEVSAVADFFKALQQQGAQDQPLRSLLHDIEHGAMPEAVAEWLLPKIERTLTSFSELHGAGARG